MAEKVASLRLDLKADGFTKELKKLERDADLRAGEMGRSFSTAMNTAAKGGISAVHGMFSYIKQGISTVGGLLGGIGVASLLKSAVDARERFRNLSLAVEVGTGKLIKWNDIQRNTQQVAKEWGKDSDDLAEALGTMFAGTRDYDFAAETLNVLATTSRATGADLGQLAIIAGVLQQKFAIAAEDMPEAMAAIVAGANAGGASIEDLAEDLAEIGGKAKTLGATGVTGLRQFLGVANLAKQETGRWSQAMTAIPQIFDQIIERGGKGGELETKFKIQTIGPDGKPREPMAILADIIRKTEGQEDKLGELGFGGEGLQTILAMAKPFQAELKRTGGDVDAATRVLKKHLEEVAGSALDWSRVQKQAVENMKDPKARIDQAVESLKEAFTAPEIISALVDLAERLPAFARIVGKVIDFVTKNPLLAGGMLTAGVFAKGAFSAALTSAATGATGAATATTGLGTAASGATLKLGGFATGLGAAAAATAAFAAAAVGVSLALDQASKLIDDLAQRDKDIEDERENLLAAAEKRGEKVARREKHYTELTPEDIFGVGGEMGVEYLTRGKGGKVVSSRTAPTEAAPVSIAMRGGEEDIPDFIKRQAKYGTPAESRREEERQKIAAYRASLTQGGKDDPSRAARAMAQEVSGRQLKTRITNTRELAADIKNAMPGTGPKAGHGD